MKTKEFALLMGCVAMSMVGCSKDSNISNQCSDVGLAQTVTNPDITLILPNGISPNGDLYNDAFAVIALSRSNPSTRPTFAFRRLKVMRMGSSQLVYDNSNYQNNFDGHDASGNELPEGNYSYDLTLDNNSAQGSVKIVRTSKACSCRAVDLNDEYLKSDCQ